jgi:DNA-binding XRE family transcriptional regulator
VGTQPLPRRSQPRQRHKAGPTDQHMDVGGELRAMRNRVGMSQRAAARELGVSKYKISRSETGDSLHAGPPG